jgi:hypothetical protein
VIAVWSCEHDIATRRELNAGDVRREGEIENRRLISSGAPGLPVLYKSAEYLPTAGAGATVTDLCGPSVQRDDGGVERTGTCGQPLV